MPNDLTGDFDVVAQFAIAAANRVLATMHRVERFPHSLSIRVDDVPPADLGVFHPTLVAVIDSFGDTVSDPGRIPDVVPVGDWTASPWVPHFALDHVVNLDNAGILDVPVKPSNLRGRAQLQLFPPTIDVADSTGTNITVRIQLIARYLPDWNTSAMAEFIRGELRITAPVSQVASQVANVVEIDIKAANVNISFAPQWSSAPLTAENLAAINLVIRNGLKTSFLPSNSTLPASIRHMQFKTLQGAGNAIAVLLDLDGGPSNRNSVNNIFLSGSDDFAIAVGADFVREAFAPTLEKILSEPVDPVSFSISTPFNTWNITYTIVLRSAVVELRAGEIVLTMKGRATTPSWPPNFNFTVTQKFSLEPDGATANLVAGDVSIDTSSWIIDRFRGRATTAIRKVRDAALSQSNARATIRRMLSADEKLGGFVNSLIKPPRAIPGQQPQRFQLAYASAEIRPSGVILHGTLSARQWPAAHVEFEQLPDRNAGPLSGTGLFDPPEYSALKSWIPGGIIQWYEWKSQGQTQPGFSEANKFVYSKPIPGMSAAFAAMVPVSGFVPLCLSVRGTRLSASGPVAAQPVSATICGVGSFPILDLGFMGDLPLIALAQPDAGGMVRIVGHTEARKAEPGRSNPNLIVLFGDSDSAGDLDICVQALGESRREDASAAIVAVLPTEALERMRYVEGITYADNRDGSWENRVGGRIAQRPVVVIMTTDGQVAWRHDGSFDAATLAGALHKYLAAGAPVIAAIQPSAVRIGHLPPNFVFRYAAGRDVTLRKMSGRRLVLVFWRASSGQSMALLRDLERPNVDGEPPLVLAINDGDAEDAGGKAAAQNKLTAVIVADPTRSISRAYGVSSWPTVVTISAAGLVESIRHGWSGDNDESSFTQQFVVGSAAP